MLSGGSLPPLNVYHNPVWMSGKSEDSQQPQNLNQMQNYERLNFLNKQLDEELNKYNSMMGKDSQNRENPQQDMNNGMNQCNFYFQKLKN